MNSFGTFSDIELAGFYYLFKKRNMNYLFTQQYLDIHKKLNQLDKELHQEIEKRDIWKILQ